MSAQPQWEPSDAYTHDLLELVAMGTPATGDGDAEWELYLNVLADVARNWGGEIQPNVVRPLLRGRVAPRRISAFANRALSQGFVEYSGDWQVSDDTEGRNRGKPARVMRWLGN